MKKSLAAILPLQYKELIQLWRFHSHKNGAEDRLSEKEIHELGRTVKEISRGLTGDRIYAAERYMNEPELLGAYLLYYWPVSFAQIVNVLNRLNLTGKKALDFGSGPGPISLAFAHLGYQEITAIDRSKPALNLAKSLMIQHKANFTILQQNLEQTLKLPKNHYDLIASGHLINELWKGSVDRTEKRAALLKNLFESLVENGRLIVMEPALMSTARELLAVRDSMLAAGFFVEYPCTFGGNCPCLATEKTTCHSEYNWELPQTVKKIAQEAGFDKSSIKTAVIVFTKKNLNHKNHKSYRVVSERMLSKSGKLRFVVCGEAGRISLSLKSPLLPQNDLLEKRFKSLKRGDLIEFSDAESRENGFELTSLSKLTIKS